MRRHTKLLRLLFVAVALGMTLTSCAPSLSPLYRDYAVAKPDSAAVLDSIRLSLREAGWQLTAPATPNIVATKPMTTSNWGLYKVRVSLEAAPVGRKNVRLYFHPYRQYIIGGRSKIMYLPGGLRRSLVPELREALTDNGLRAIGTPFERDEADMRR